MLSQATSIEAIGLMLLWQTATVFGIVFVLLSLFD